MKALSEIGWGRALRFGFFTLAMHPKWPALLRVLTAVVSLLTFALLLLAWRGSSDRGGNRHKLQMAATITATVLAFSRRATERAVADRCRSAMADDVSAVMSMPRSTSITPSSNRVDTSNPA